MSKKTVLAVHDISCIGRCSLTAAIPIISSVGVTCIPLPTAVLSTHTGGFTDYTYRDLTEDMIPTINHWKKIGYHFDAIYTGFLGSMEQVSIVSDLFDSMKNAIKIVDPVMGDEGVLYKTFDSSFPAKMRKLCEKADVIIPNITEATMMLGQKFKKGPYEPQFIDDLIDDLLELGAKKIVLTGVSFDEKKLGIATFDSENGEKSYYFSDLIPGYYHGSGDVFGSAFVSALINGHSIAESGRIAVDFTVGSINRTYKNDEDKRFGVDFEEEIPHLISDILGNDSDVHSDDD